MNLSMKTDDLKVAITEYLKTQGFSMKNKSVDLSYKIKYLGKGLGYDVTTNVQIEDLPVTLATKPTLDPVVEAEPVEDDSFFGD